MADKYFKVEAKMTSYSYIHVKAPDADTAQDIARNTDGGVFISDESDMGGWDVLEPEEITEDQVDFANLITGDENDEEVA